MDILPAIDLRDGGVVRLAQGDYSRTTRYGLDPLEVACGFEEAGARFLHVVDLDGALDGTLANFDVVRRIAEGTGLVVEVGGGIRDLARIESYLDVGVGRVILGTAAVKDPAFLDAALARFGAEAVVVGVDLRDGRVAVSGWTEDSGLDGMGFCRSLVARGATRVVCTDIACDGMLAGTNRALYARLAAIPGLSVIASGGVTDESDIAALRDAGVEGAIVGKALYEGRIDLAHAIAVASGGVEGEPV